MESRTKVFWLLLLIACNLIMISLHVQLPKEAIKESFNTADLVQERIEQQLSVRSEEEFKLKLIDVSNSSRKILRLPLKQHSFSITDFLLDLQKDLNKYGLEIHGRTSLPEYAWRFHILYKQQIIRTLEIEVVD